MIPLPAWLASPLRLIAGVVLLVCLGAGAVIGWQWWRNRDEKQAVESKPAIVQNQRAIDTATADNVLLTRTYRASAAQFRQHASVAHANPGTSSEVKACYDAGLTVISHCDSLHRSDSTLVALYKRRSELMEDEAVRARRGRLFQVTTAGGYDPLWGAPALRAGVELNFSDHWSAIGTADIAAKIKRDSTITRRSAFIGLNYRFGGRNP